MAFRRILRGQEEAIHGLYWIRKMFDDNLQGETKAIEDYAEAINTIKREPYWSGSYTDPHNLAEKDKRLMALQTETITKIREIQNEERVHHRELQELKAKWEALNSA